MSPILAFFVISRKVEKEPWYYTHKKSWWKRRQERKQAAIREKERIAEMTIEIEMMHARQRKHS